MKRILSLVLVLAMLLSALIGVVSFAEEEESAAPALEVSQANLEFSTAVYLYIAVNYSELGSADGITLKITNNKTGKSTVLAPNSKIAAPSNCVAFKYIDLGSKNMGDELTLQALKDGVPSGDAKTYSILEYALKAQAQDNDDLAELMDAMLQYGADAQKAFKYEGTYDLAKDYTLVKVSGLASINGGAKKMIAERGTKVTATASGAASYVWYNYAIQRQGTGASIELNTEGTYQAIFAAPASVANTESYELDMDKYTGNGGEYYGYYNANNKMTTGFQAHNGVGGAASDKIAWFGGSFANTSLNEDNTPKSKVIVQKGYISWDPGVGINFNSSLVTKAVGESVSDYAKAVIAGTSTEGLNSVVSLSITMAADGDAGLLFSRWHLRYGGTGTLTTANASTHDGTSSKPGRLNLLQANGTTLKTSYLKDASNTAAANTTTVQNIITVPKGASGEPGEFVTFHIVIDIGGNGTCPMCNGNGTDCATCGGDGKIATISYYVGDSTMPVAVVVNPAPMTFFANIASGYLNGEAGNSGSIGYLKAFTVTNGNITDYFK